MVKRNSRSLQLLKFKKSEILVTHIQILMYYSTFTQTKASQSKSFSDQLGRKSMTAFMCQNDVFSVWRVEFLLKTDSGFSSLHFSSRNLLSGEVNKGLWEHCAHSFVLRGCARTRRCVSRAGLEWRAPINWVYTARTQVQIAMCAHLILSVCAPLCVHGRSCILTYA